MVGDMFSSDIKIRTMAKAYSDNLYSIESAYVKSLTHILLLQNFCKANNIPYKIFCKTESFSNPFYPLFDINYSNEETEFNSTFIDKKLTKKDSLTFINSDPYVSNLFSILDLDNFWFLDHPQCKYGGITEWIYLNNEYKSGELEYTPLTIEDIDKHTLEERPVQSIETLKRKMKEKKFDPNGHPSYYYWNLFTKNEITKWGIL
jgi:hypothetical protein